jgi:hypothetical protein
MLDTKLGSQREGMEILWLNPLENDNIEEGKRPARTTTLRGYLLRLGRRVELRVVQNRV